MSGAPDGYEREVFRGLVDTTKTAFDMEPTDRPFVETEQNKIYSEAFAEFCRSSRALETVIERCNDVDKRDLYYEVVNFAYNLATLNGIISPLLPESKLEAQRRQMAEARPKRPEWEEALISDALATWSAQLAKAGDDLTVYKLSEATSVDLASKRVKIGGKALRDRFKTFVQ